MGSPPGPLGASYLTGHGGRAEGRGRGRARRGSSERARYTGGNGSVPGRHAADAHDPVWSEMVLKTLNAANTPLAAANFVLRVNTCTSPTPAARRPSSIATPWALFRQAVPLFLPQELILWTL